DLAIGDFNGDGIQDIVTISLDDTDGDFIGDSGHFTIFYGLGDGTFNLPRTIRTAGVPVSVAVTDLDGDGLSDIAIAEQGFVAVYTGGFLQTGRMGLVGVDRFGDPNANPPGTALITTPGARVVSIGFRNLDKDPVADIAVAEQGAVSGRIELFIT